MGTIQTVAGELNPVTLGTTLMHERVSVRNREIEESGHEIAPNRRSEHNHHDALPAPRGQGLSDGQMGQMLVGNPLRIFRNVGAC
ncbi:MAG TPA: hypothetical protein VFA95_13810 [Gammaproteobacteria bacterium]|nr:hypothetical protein [Gammaproteobacteria bacterium]